MADIHPIGIARVHDDPGDSAAARILVDRLWPRGIRKDSLHHDAWIKEVAPSTGLRQWFGHLDVQAALYSPGAIEAVCGRGAESGAQLPVKHSRLGIVGLQ